VLLENRKEKQDNGIFEVSFVILLIHPTKICGNEISNDSQY